MDNFLIKKRRGGVMGRTRCKWMLRRFAYAITMASLLLLPCYVWPAASATTASDLEGHWACVYFEQAQSQGWVHGYEDGSMRPDKAVSRG